MEQTLETLMLLDSFFTKVLKHKKVPLGYYPLVLFTLVRIKKMKYSVSKIGKTGHVKNQAETLQLLSDMDKTLSPYLEYFADHAKKMQRFL